MPSLENKYPFRGVSRHDLPCSRDNSRDDTLKSVLLEKFNATLL
jgi:hypothetical protein